MWVTVLASQPSVSMDTLTTHRTGSPSLSFLPTVFITSRRISALSTSSADRPGNRRRYSAVNSSISAAATRLNSGDSASPDSSCRESTRILGGLLPARNVVVDHLRHRRVVADDDEYRRRLAVPGRRRALPQPGRLLIRA